MVGSNYTNEPTNIETNKTGKTVGAILGPLIQQDISIRRQDEFEVRGKINIRRQTWGGNNIFLSLSLSLSLCISLSLSLFLFAAVAAAAATAPAAPAAAEPAAAAATAAAAGVHRWHGILAAEQKQQQQQ